MGGWKEERKRGERKREKVIEGRMKEGRLKEEWMKEGADFYALLGNIILSNSVAWRVAVQTKTRLGKGMREVASGRRVKACDERD